MNSASDATPTRRTTADHSGDETEQRPPANDTNTTNTMNNPSAGASNSSSTSSSQSHSHSSSSSSISSASTASTGQAAALSGATMGSREPDRIGGAGAAAAPDDGAVAGPSGRRHYHEHSHHLHHTSQPSSSSSQHSHQPVYMEDSYREFCEQFQFENIEFCWICNGYYAPNFGEPVCGVCHAFVFAVAMHDGIKLESTTLPSDDEDSGNDEPPYNAADRDRAGGAEEEEEEDADADEQEVDEDVDEDDDDDDDDAVAAEPEMELENGDAVGGGDDAAEGNGEGPAGAIAAGGNDVYHHAGHAPVPAAAAAAGAAVVDAGAGAAAANHNNRVAIDVRPAGHLLNVEQYIDMLSQPYDGANEANTIDALPVEVLLAIFKHLDDVSLWYVSKVCRRWRTILETNITPSIWQRYVHDRWPLFEPAARNSRPTVPTSAASPSSSSSSQAAPTPSTGATAKTVAPPKRNWFNIYSALMASTFCRTCLVQMGLAQPLQGRITSFRFNRLRCDFRALELDEIEGIAAQPLDASLSHWQATIVGPAGSPYEGGKFFLYIVFPSQYPMQPPTVRFLTKIIHPNVSRHGDVGCDIIQHNWSLALTISKLLLSVQSLLTDPFTEICMEPQVGRLYAEDRSKFNALARSWTRKYAMLELLV